MGKGERIEGFFYDDYNWTTQENTIKDDHLDVCKLPQTKYLKAAFAEHLQPGLAAIANRVIASESMAFQKYGQGIYERLNETIFSTYSNRLGGAKFTITKEAMEDDIMGSLNGQWTNEDGSVCKDRLEVMEAKLKVALESQAKCDESVMYLPQVVEKAKSDPAYRALLEVM